MAEFCMLVARKPLGPQVPILPTGIGVSGMALALGDNPCITPTKPHEEAAPPQAIVQKRRPLFGAEVTPWPTVIRPLKQKTTSTFARIT
jgi:hypothetical protein